MSSEKRLPPMPDAEERLFRRVAQKEAEGHQVTRDLTPEFLEYLGFRTVAAVERAALKIRAYDHWNNWGGGVCLMRVENGKLFCGPHVEEAWDDYQNRSAD